MENTGTELLRTMGGKMTDKQLVEKCRMWINKLNKGTTWTLRVPPDPEVDPDILFSELIDRYEMYLKLKSMVKGLYLRVNGLNISEGKMTRDEFLTEKMGIERRLSPPEIWFFVVWEWAREQDWWNNFWNDIFCNADDEYEEKTGVSIHHGYFWQKYLAAIFGNDKCLINPNRFADAVAQYLGWRKNL